MEFKKRNIWHHGDFDLDKEYWKEIKNDNFSHPWLFISAPSLLTDKGVLCPIGHETLEILTFANHNHFKKLFNSIHIGSCWYYNLKYYGVDKYLDLKGSDKITFHEFISKNFEINFEQFFGNFEFYKNKYKPIEF